MTAAHKQTDLPRLVPGQVIDIPLHLIVPDPDQPRTEFDKDALADLADDIKRRGVEQPIRVRSDGERYVIKHGERRWRASQIAKLETIPCLLASPADDKAPELERYFDQVLDNHHQRPLSPMDMARFLKKLVDVHGLQVKDIPAELDRRGLTMSRPYVSNLMRLTELPDWAQDLIARGLLTAADGKMLLIAKPHTPAMDYLKKEILAEAKKVPDGERLRFDNSIWGEPGVLEYGDAEDAVKHAYEETAIQLNVSYGENAPLFKWETECKGCEHRQKAGDGEFCLNAKEFEKKQAVARKEIEAKGKTVEQHQAEAGRDAKPKKQKPTGPTKLAEKRIDKTTGVVDISGLKNHQSYNFLDSYNVRFEPAVECEGCPDKRMAVEYKGQGPKPCCFDLSCFENLNRNASRSGQVADWLDKRILAEIVSRLPGNHELQFQIITWMALNGPTQNDNEVPVGRALQEFVEQTRFDLTLTTPGRIIEAHNGGRLNTEAIAATGVRALLQDRGNFYALARYLGIELTPAIAAADAEYFGFKRKGELLEIARDVIATFTTQSLEDRDLTLKDLATCKVPEIIERLMQPEFVERLGVPPDVQRFYYNLEPQFDPEFYSHMRDLDESDGDEDDDATDADAEPETAAEETEGTA